MKRFIAVVGACMLVAGFSIPGAAQWELNVIDTPTAHVLNKNRYYLSFRFYQQGGVLLQGSAGLAERLTIGAAYGGVGVVGTELIRGNPEPTFFLKYQAAEEGGEHFPFALSVGYDGQGYGKYYRQGETITIDGASYVFTKSFYQINSKGFYLVLSKAFQDRRWNVHGGINHCLEEDPGKAGLSFFMGTEFNMTPQLAIQLEYNNGFHGEITPEDVLRNASGLQELLRKAGGEFNVGLRLRYAPTLILEINFKDLSGIYTDNGNRTFQVIYSGEF